MKIIPAGGTPGNGARKYVPGRPTWLKEWLDNKGKYVELACGHMVDLNDRSIAPLIHPSNKMVDCEIHRSWQPVIRNVRFTEYCGIIIPPAPDEPLF